MDVVESNLIEIKTRAPNNSPIHIFWMIERIEEYRSTLRQIVNHLGPEMVDCEAHIEDGKEHCEGLLAEAHEALRIAKEALGYTDANQQVLDRITKYVRSHELGVPIDTITRKFKLTNKDTDSFIATLEGRGIVRKLRGDPNFVKVTDGDTEILKDQSVARRIKEKVEGH